MAGGTLMAEQGKAAKKKRIKKSLPKHVVVFQDDQGAVLKTGFVNHGQAAVPPQPPVFKGREEHYQILFDGWDQDYSEVRSNLVIKPLWRREPKKYLVMYFHENGAMLGMESVAYGSPALKPVRPEKDSDGEYDYPFIGWNCDLSAIKGDTRAKAVFGKVRRVFIVRFYHEDGSLLKEEKVHYDEEAHPPANVIKPRDETYHYEFAGWSYPTDHIRSSLNIHAVFKYIYNEYTISFYSEETLSRKEKLHYGDSIQYPVLRRKGYDLSWDKYLSTVTEDQEIRAIWTFSNPAGKVVSTSHGDFKLINPSSHQGTVCCLRYHRPGEKKVKLPPEIRLGDYYYKITEIEACALKNCDRMETLVLPDSIKKIRDKGLAGCRRLRRVVFGKEIKSLGKYIFADDVRLKNLVFTGKNLRYVDKRVLDQAPGRISVEGTNRIAAVFKC